MLKRTVKKVALGMTVDKEMLFDKLDDIRNAITYVHKDLMQHDTILDKLKLAVKNVEPYQPIYGLPDIISDARRSSRDRCELIMRTLGGDVSSLRFLDIGSSLGYVSFFLADRGAWSEGWEFNPKNMDVTLMAQTLNGITRAKFKLKEFDADSVATIKPGDFDVAIMLSVVHHITHHKGLDYVKDLMKALTDRVPVMIVELAKRNEDKTLFWNDAQPPNELDIFEKCDVKVELLGEFSNHLSKKTRPIYKISRKHITVNGKPYELAAPVSYEAYAQSPMRNVGALRRYYTTKTAFIKEYVLESGVTSGHKYQIFNELTNSLKFELQLKQPKMPKLLDYEVKNDNIKLVFEKIDGCLLDGAPAALKKMVGLESIGLQIAECLAQLEELALYHNDVRSWNVMLVGKHVYVIDFGLVDAKPAENNAIAFLWLLHAAITGQRESLDEGKTVPPEREQFKPYPRLLSVHDAIVKKHEERFAALSKILKR